MMSIALGFFSLNPSVAIADVMGPKPVKITNSQTGERIELGCLYAPDPSRCSTWLMKKITQDGKQAILACGDVQRTFEDMLMDRYSAVDVWSHSKEFFEISYLYRNALTGDNSPRLLQISERAFNAAGTIAFVTLPITAAADLTVDAALATADVARNAVRPKRTLEQMKLTALVNRGSWFEHLLYTGGTAELPSRKYEKIKSLILEADYPMDGHGCDHVQ